MRKNLLRTGIGVAVGCSLLITSTVMSMASSPNGYDTLKEAIKNSKKVQDETFNMSGSFSDNSKELVKVESTFKASQKDELISGEISINAEEINKSFVFYGTEDQMVFKDNDKDVYNKVECDKRTRGKKHNLRERHSKNHEDPQMEMIGEKIFDTLVGDLKNQVTQEEIGNGEKRIGFELDKNEIPSLVNLMFAAKSDRECDKADKMHEIMGIDQSDCKLPELTSNIKAEKIDVEIVVDKNNIIKELDMELKVTGNDADNKPHVQELKLSIDVSDINSTVVDTIDLKGKEVKEISHTEY